MSDQKKPLLDWLFGMPEKTYTVQEVRELVESIKVFNAGAIDDYLTKHVDEVFNEWLESHKES